jgi:peptidoglycan/LPS O-acetylase OafA/YrhL
MSQLFVNHYQTKLLINNVYFDIIFCIVLAILVLITLKKSDNCKLFSENQTAQVRGLAIILIILNHICYYTDPVPSMYQIWTKCGMIGVSIFLILSGYGISLSISNKGIDNFFQKRAKKIFIPLFLSLLFLQILRVILTDDETSLIEALLKIPFSMMELDTKTWFIIFILFWYCLLYYSHRLNLSKTQILCILFLTSIILVSIPSTFKLAKFNSFSFPFGYWLGLNSFWIKIKLESLIKSKAVYLLSTFIIGNCLFSAFLLSLKIQGRLAFKIIFLLIISTITISSIFLGYLVFFKKKKVNIQSETIFSAFIITIIYINYTSLLFEVNILDRLNIIQVLITNFGNIGFAINIISFVLLTFRFQVFSMFLKFLGNISFELFLTHNIFLIHFDFFLFRLPIEISFFIYFIMVCLFSLLLKKICEWTYRLI